MLFRGFIFCCCFVNLYSADDIDFDRLMNGSKQSSSTNHIIEVKRISSSELDKARNEAEKLNVTPTIIGGVISNILTQKREIGDLQAICFATVKHDDSWCGMIKSKDMRNSCYATVKYDDSWCGIIKSEDIRNSCYATVKHKESWCGIIKSEDMRNSCYATVKHEESWCGVIKSKDIRNGCYAILKYDDSWCGLIKN